MVTISIFCQLTQRRLSSDGNSASVLVWLSVSRGVVEVAVTVVMCLFGCGGDSVTVMLWLLASGCVAVVAVM